MAETVVGEELRKIKEALKIDLKALLFGSKDGLTERELKHDYRELTGIDIPFARLGYRTLYDLIRDMSEDFIIKRHSNGNTWIYYAIHSSDTKDLGRLVLGQLDRNKQIREQRRNNEKIFKNGRRSYEGMPSCETLPPFIQNNIEFILKNAPNFKLKIKEFEKEYIIRNGFMFNFKQFGYSSLREALNSLKHLVICENSKFNSQDYTVSLIVSRREIFINQNINKMLKSNLRNEQITKNENDSTRIEYLTFEDELIINIVNMVESKGEEGAPLSSLLSLYKSMYQVPLDFEKLGFSSFDDFVYEKLESKLKFKYPKDSYTELRLYGKNAKIDQQDLKSAKSKEMKQNEPIDLEAKINELKKYIENAFRPNSNKKLSIDDFKRLFEMRNGWKLDHREFGLRDFDALIAKLGHYNIIEIDFDQNHNVSIGLFKNQNISLNKSNDSSKYSDIFKLAEETSFEEKQQYQAKFIQDFVFYNQDFNLLDTLKLIADKERHVIKISNINSVEDFQIHIFQNVPLLDKLMEDLEICYHGIGSSSYDMPIDYVQHGKICAAIYPGDNNWHRCRITGISPETNQARVEFIDYGGFSNVGIRNLKFLDKKFAKLPVQAINARLNNVKRCDKRKDFINYMLKIIIDKPLEARIVGVNGGRLSLEIYERTSQGNCINLNKRVIMDGYGIQFDETKDVDFDDFETWRKETFLDSDLVKNENGENDDQDGAATTTSYECESSTNETESEAVFKRRQKKIDNFFRPSLKSVQELESYSESLSENAKQMNNNSKSSKSNDINNDADFDYLHVRHKLANFKVAETEEEIKLYLFKLNEQLYLHPIEVADLFGINLKILKLILTSEPYNDKNYFKIFKDNDYNKNLFYLIRDDLKFERNFDHDEIMMISYRNILDLVKEILGGQNLIRVKSAINYRKLKARQFFNENKKLYNDEEDNNKLNQLISLMNNLSNEAFILRKNLLKSKNDSIEFKNTLIDIISNEKLYKDTHNSLIETFGADIDFENI